MQAKKNTRRKREQPVKRLTLPSLKKSWKELGGKVGVLLLFLFGGYYVFFLGPQLALPNAYLKAQEVFAQHRSNLLENRTALVELARLSATTSDLANKETELLGKLQKTNEDGLVSVESNRRIPFVPGASNEFLDFLNNDLRTALSELLEKERQIFEEQRALIASLTNLNSAVANLLRYNATADLGQLDLSLQKEELTPRAAATKEGIKKISENLASLFQKSSEIELLQEEIQGTQDMLDAFVLQVEQRNARGTEDILQELIAQFAVLKEKTLSAQFALIRSDSSVKLLTRQTNLVLEYDFWLKRISAKQAQLAKE